MRVLTVAIVLLALAAPPAARAAGDDGAELRARTHFAAGEYKVSFRLIDVNTATITIPQYPLLNSPMFNSTSQQFPLCPSPQRAGARPSAGANTRRASSSGSRLSRRIRR